MLVGVGVNLPAKACIGYERKFRMVVNMEVDMLAGLVRGGE